MTGSVNNLLKSQGTQSIYNLSLSEHFKIQGKSNLVVIEILVWRFNPKVIDQDFRLWGLIYLWWFPEGCLQDLVPSWCFSWYLLRLLVTLFPPAPLCQLSRRILRAAPTLCKLQTCPGESNLPLLLSPQLAALCSLLKIQMIGVVVFM